MYWPPEFVRNCCATWTLLVISRLPILRLNLKLVDWLGRSVLQNFFPSYFMTIILAHCCTGRRSVELPVHQSLSMSASHAHLGIAWERFVNILLSDSFLGQESFQLSAVGSYLDIVLINARIKHANSFLRCSGKRCSYR